MDACDEHRLFFLIKMKEYYKRRKTEKDFSTVTTDTNALHHRLKEPPHTRREAGTAQVPRPPGSQREPEPSDAPVLCSLFSLGTCLREVRGSASPSPCHPPSPLLLAGLVICKTQASLRGHLLQACHHFPRFHPLVLVKPDLGPTLL